MGPNKAMRAKLFRALHAEAVKRGMDHDALRDAFGVKSMSTIPTEQLQDRLKAWTGKSVRRTTPLPRRGYGKTGELQLAGIEEFATLQNAFQIAGMDGQAQRGFIRRQLGGREEVRTVADFHRVFSGVRAINRRNNAQAH